MDVLWLSMMRIGRQQRPGSEKMRSSLAAMSRTSETLAAISRPRREAGAASARASWSGSSSRRRRRSWWPSRLWPPGSPRGSARVVGVARVDGRHEQRVHDVAHVAEEVPSWSRQVISARSRSESSTSKRSKRFQGSLRYCVTPRPSHLRTISMCRRDNQEDQVGDHDRVAHAVDVVMVGRA